MRRPGTNRVLARCAVLIDEVAESLWHVGTHGPNPTTYGCIATAWVQYHRVVVALPDGRGTTMRVYWNRLGPLHPRGCQPLVGFRAPSRRHLCSVPREMSSLLPRAFQRVVSVSTGRPCQRASNPAPRGRRVRGGTVILAAFQTLSLIHI